MLKNIGSFRERVLARMSLSKWWPAVTILGFTLLGCDNTSAPSFTPMPDQGEATSAVQVGRVEPLRFGYTHQRPDGNRMMLGRGALPEASPIDILLEGTPQWVVSDEEKGKDRSASQKFFSILVARSEVEYVLGQLPHPIPIRLVRSFFGLVQ